MNEMNLERNLLWKKKVRVDCLCYFGISSLRHNFAEKRERERIGKTINFISFVVLIIRYTIFVFCPSFALFFFFFSIQFLCYKSRTYNMLHSAYKFSFSVTSACSVVLFSFDINLINRFI